jgi:hypothetical protein
MLHFWDFLRIENAIHYIFDQIICLDFCSLSIFSSNLCVFSATTCPVQALSDPVVGWLNSPHLLEWSSFWVLQVVGTTINFTRVWKMFHHLLYFFLFLPIISLWPFKVTFNLHVFKSFVIPSIVANDSALRTSRSF